MEQCYSHATRTKSVKPSLSSVVSRRSTATLVCADTRMRAGLPAAAWRQGPEISGETNVKTRQRMPFNLRDEYLKHAI